MWAPEAAAGKIKQAYTQRAKNVHPNDASEHPATKTLVYKDLSGRLAFFFKAENLHQPDVFDWQNLRFISGFSSFSKTLLFKRF